MQLFMKAIGCHWAFNIDGGGSSTFIVRKDGSSFTDGSRFQVKNKPSDGTERAIGPGLAVVSVD
jgi:exopolysaccharide biosynthesis protein